MSSLSVVERARVSRKVFYEHFGDKQACFIAACTEGAEIMFARILDATRTAAGEKPEATLGAGLRAYLEFIRDEQAHTRASRRCIAAGTGAHASIMRDGRASTRSFTTRWSERHMRSSSR